MTTINLHQLRTVDSLVQNLPAIIEYYDSQLDDVEDTLRIQNKSASTCLHEQAAWPIRFRFLKSELDKLVKHLTSIEDSVRGAMYEKLTKSATMAWSERGKDKVIDHDPEYLSVHSLVLEVTELRDKFQAVGEAFEIRGFALRDMTKLKEIQQYTELV